jgi:hypothetical protein
VAMTGEVKYFLLFFDREKGSILDLQIFEPEEQAMAFDAYAEAERKHVAEIYRPNAKLEIVLLGADDLDTLRRTHSHYFGNTESRKGLVQQLIGQVKELAALPALT